MWLHRFDAISQSIMSGHNNMIYKYYRNRSGIRMQRLWRFGCKALTICIHVHRILHWNNEAWKARFSSMNKAYVIHSALFVLQNTIWTSVRRTRITATRMPPVPTLTTRSLADVTMVSPETESSATVSWIIIVNESSEVFTLVNSYNRDIIFLTRYFIIYNYVICNTPDIY